MEPWQPQPAPDGSANFRFNDYCPNRKNVNPNRMKSVPPAPYAVGAVNHAVAIGDARFAVACEEGRAVEVDDVATLADKIGSRHRQAGAHSVDDHRSDERSVRKGTVSTCDTRGQSDYLNKKEKKR